MLTFTKEVFNGEIHFWCSYADNFAKIFTAGVFLRISQNFLRQLLLPEVPSEISPNNNFGQHFKGGVHENESTLHTYILKEVCS